MYAIERDDPSIRRSVIGYSAPAELGDWSDARIHAAD